MYRVILIGPPGAGKGTQAELLVKSFGLSQISTGDILRQSAKSGDALGLQANSYMQAGKLVPDELVIGIVANYLQQDMANGFLLDGFPRNISQAQALDTMGVVISHVISIEVDDEVIIKRMSGRRVHVESGRVYHVDYNPPKINGIDDVTSQPLVQRKDDQEDTVRDRLNIYHELTKPLLDYYKKNAATGCYKFISIAGNGDIQAVHNKLKSLL